MDGRTAVVLLDELVGHLVDLGDRRHLVERQADDATLLGDGLQDALANPPYGIGDKLKAAGLVKLLSCLDQADVALVDQIGQRETLVLILLGYGHDKTQVGFNQLFLGALTLSAALVNLLRKFYLLIDGDHGLAANLYEVLVECFTGAVGDALLNFKLSHVLFISPSFLPDYYWRYFPNIHKRLAKLYIFLRLGGVNDGRLRIFG